MATEVFDEPEIGKLILRVSFGMMFLLHGLNKIRIGTYHIQQLLAEHNLPEYLAYLVFITEIIVPILIIIGVYTRLSACFGFFTCAFTMFHLGNFFEIETYSGAWSLEPFGVYLFTFMSLMFLGSGKYAMRAD